ncbi:MAG: T9SS type A sorting domain-containing protein [Saprospiraceae bacterium]|nr:T9SS type A sorting domain-containing protein [Saprospiraceae bacterium]
MKAQYTWTLLVTLALSGEAAAQQHNSLPIGQTWNYELFGGWNPNVYGPSSLTVVADTIISGITAQKLEMTFNGPHPPSVYFAYTTANEVYAWYPFSQGFGKIYDFSLQSGDTLALSAYKKYRIDSSGVTTAFGPALRFQHISFYGQGWTNGPYLVLEGAGMVGRPGFQPEKTCAFFFLQNSFCGSPVDGVDHFFKCFTSPNWQLDPYGNCLTADSAPAAPPFTLTPNPCFQTCRITNAVTPFETVAVFDLAGRLLKSYRLDYPASGFAFSVIDLPAGMVFIRLDQGSFRPLLIRQP